MTEYVAGVDLGATNLRAMASDAQGAELARGNRPTPQGPTGEEITGAVLDLLSAVCGDAGIDPEDLDAVGVGSIGPLDLASGTVEKPANIPGVDRIRLGDPIQDLVGTGRVYVHNDANAGVIGERFHADPNPDDMIYLTISSGIGAGVCVDGHVLRGWDGNAGEVGHVVVDPAGRRTCGCGHDGHWEAYCSGTNIPAYARLLYEDDPVDTDLPLDNLAAPDVFSRPDDPLAARVIDRVARWNAIGVATLVHAFAPLVVSIGGPVALRNEALVIDPIRDRVADMVVTGVPEIRPATLDDDVVLRGAIASAITGGTAVR